MDFMLRWQERFAVADDGDGKLYVNAYTCTATENGTGICRDTVASDIPEYFNAQLCRLAERANKARTDFLEAIAEYDHEA